MPRRSLSHDTRILLMTLAAGLPGTLITLLLFWLGDYTPKVQWTITVLVLAVYFGFAFASRQRVVIPLQTLSNLLAALREGDSSIRARISRPDDPLGEVLLEANILAETLRQQRLGEVEATALLSKVMEEIDVAVFAFDADRRLALVNRAGERLLDRPVERLRGAMADELATMRDHSGAVAADPVSALAALLAPDGRLSKQCAFCYELRLHRARGYGALKAILEILAEEEGLTLTEISLRLQRTPGSAKDYLSWLQDVDLVTSRQKRYSFTDPLLRVWVRLHCRTSAPSEDDLAREVHRYAFPRLPQQEPRLPKEPEAAYALAATSASATGLIEID